MISLKSSYEYPPIITDNIGNSYRPSLVNPHQKPKESIVTSLSGYIPTRPIEYTTEYPKMPKMPSYETMYFFFLNTVAFCILCAMCYSFYYIQTHNFKNSDQEYVKPYNFV